MTCFSEMQRCNVAARRQRGEAKVGKVMDGQLLRVIDLKVRSAAEEMCVLLP